MAPASIHAVGMRVGCGLGGDSPCHGHRRRHPPGSAGGSPGGPHAPSALQSHPKHRRAARSRAVPARVARAQSTRLMPASGPGPGTVCTADPSRGHRPEREGPRPGQRRAQQDTASRFSRRDPTPPPHESGVRGRGKTEPTAPGSPHAHAPLARGPATAPSDALLAHTRSHARSHAGLLKHTLMHTHARSLTHTHTHTHSLTNTLAHSHAHTPAYSHSYLLTHTCSHSRSPSPPLRTRSLRCPPPGGARQAASGHAHERALHPVGCSAQAAGRRVLGLH